MDIIIIRTLPVPGIIVNGWMVRLLPAGWLIAMLLLALLFAIIIPKWIKKLVNIIIDYSVEWTSRALDS